MTKKLKSKILTQNKGVFSAKLLFFAKHLSSLKNLTSKKVNSYAGFLSKTRILFGFALIILLFGAFFVPSHRVSAAGDVIEIENIRLRTEMEVNGRPGNFARVGLDGDLEVTVKIYLESPAGLDLGRDGDRLNMDRWNTRNRLIQGFGAGIKTTDDDGDYKCAQDTLNSTGKKTLVCKFYDDALKTYFIQSNPVPAGGEVINTTFRVSGSDLDRLGIDLDSAGAAGSTTGGVGNFHVYPIMSINNSPPDPTWQSALLGPIGLLWDLTQPNLYFTFSPPQEFYVEVFQNDADAQAADAANLPPPGSVPAYNSQASRANFSDSGSGLLGLINKIIGILLGFLQELIFLIFFWLIAPVIQAMLSIRTYTDAFAGVIYPGWEVVRNVANITFIIALIAIGLGTLFRLQSYQYRPLLIQLILAAFLVNFSLVIGQAVLGIADTVQNQFLPNNVEVIRSLAKDLMVGYRGEVYGVSLNDAGYFAKTVQPLFLLALSLGSFFVFLAIAAFLVIRIVMLWILLMISPLAYVAGILPSTTQYRSQWWQTFIKYAFFTPIMAFFLNMAAVVANAQQGNPVLQRVLEDPSILGSDTNLGAFVFSVASNILLLVFLLVGLKVSEQAGVYGASAISNIAKKGIFAPFVLAGKGVKAGTSFGVEKFFERTGVDIRPTKWIEGYKASREINRKRREDTGMQKAEGRHTFGNPTAFFQRHWTPSTLIGKRIREDKKGQDLMAKAKQEDEKAEKVNEKMEALKEKLNSASGDEKERITQELKALEAQKQGHLKLARRYEYDGKLLIMPPDYYTQSSTRHDVQEEKGKIHAETWEELVDLSNGALKEGNVTRYLAIMHKLAETYNENELLTHTEYIEDMSAEESADGKAHKKGDTFDQTAEGLENFRKQIMMKKFGMSDQASMRSMADITDVAERHNHWGIARAYGTKYGKLFFKPEVERDAEARAEKAKIDEGTKNGKFNRLGDFDELVDTDYLASGIRFDLIQNNGLLDLMQGQQNVRFRLSRGTLNNSKLKAASFGANVALMEHYKSQLDPDIMIKKKDARGNQQYYREDVTDSKGVFHKAGDEIMISLRDDIDETIKELKMAGREQWGENEEYDHQQALLRRVNSDTLPERHKKNLVEAGYLVKVGTKKINNKDVDQYDVQTTYKIEQNFEKPENNTNPQTFVPPDSDD